MAGFMLKQNKVFFVKICWILASVITVVGCAGVNTFPTLARPGDTISVLIGGSEQARKDNVSAILTDANSQQWDLQALGNVRSVFSVRPDARAQGVNYADYLDSVLPWSAGHEPIQTIMITDIPSGVATGQASLSVATSGSDNSAAISQPFTVNLEIVPGAGSSDNFQWQNFTGVHLTNFSDIEPAPHGKIDLDVVNQGDPTTIGAVSLVVDFDEVLVAPGDVNVFVPEALVRPSGIGGGVPVHGDYQSMSAWRQDGDRVYINIIAPKGMPMTFLKVYVMHPNTVTGSSIFSVVSSDFYDLNGVPMSGVANLTYHP